MITLWILTLGTFWSEGPPYIIFSRPILLFNRVISKPSVNMFPRLGPILSPCWTESDMDQAIRIVECKVVNKVMSFFYVSRRVSHALGLSSIAQCSFSVWSRVSPRDRTKAMVPKTRAYPLACLFAYMCPLLAVAESLATHCACAATLFTVLILGFMRAKPRGFMGALSIKP